MEIDGTYAHNITKSLTITYDADPKGIYNNHSYDGCGQAIRDNVLNRFKDHSMHVQWQVVSTDN